MISKQTESRSSIALFAYSQPGFACLSELIKIGANVSVVFTHIDADDEEIWFDSVYDLAKKNNEDLKEIDGVKYMPIYTTDLFANNNLSDDEELIKNSKEQ